MYFIFYVFFTDRTDPLVRFWKIGFTALLKRVKSKVKCGIAFDARQICCQIYNLFTYSFDLGKGEIKCVAILSQMLQRFAAISYSRNYREIGYKLSEQPVLGSFGWTSFTYNWSMVVLNTYFIFYFYFISFACH